MSTAKRKVPPQRGGLEREREGKEELEREIRIQVPGLVSGDLVAEQIWDHSSAAPRFALRNFGSDRIGITDHIPTGRKDVKGRDIFYVPVDNGHLRKQMVLVPDGPTEGVVTFDDVYGEACELAFEIYDCEESKKNEFKLLVAIAIGSWFLDRFVSQGTLVAGMGMYAPIIAIRGRSGSGKNRALNALRLVSYRPFYDLATVRTPSLYRPLDLWKGSLCLDECDVSGKETSDFIHLVNSRCYGTPISRQNPDAPRFADVFSSFGLTIVTQRRSWLDDATENRTLPHYAVKSQKKLPTSELDSWIDKGLALQNKLLYLRLAHWDEVNIDKTARVEGVSDHRLTASVLPILALKELAPEMVSNLEEILLSLERKRREVRAASTDGTIVNALWGRIEEGLVGRFGRNLYVGKEKISEKGTESEGVSYILPLQTSALAEDLKWESATALRRVVHGLQLVEKAPDKIRVGRYICKPIWFDPPKFEPLLEDFVVDYETGALEKVLASAGSDMPLALEPPQTPQPPQNGVPTGEDRQTRAKETESVAVVPVVAVSTQVGGTDERPGSVQGPIPTVDAKTASTFSNRESNSIPSDLFEQVKGSEQKDHGPYFRCKVHGGYFEASGLDEHRRAYHKRSETASEVHG